MRDLENMQSVKSLHNFFLSLYLLLSEQYVRFLEPSRTADYGITFSFTTLR